MAVYVSDPEKILFVHNPKTGGTSIANWLTTNFEGVKGDRIHWPLSNLKEQFPDYAISFAVVRNPWDRMVSYYFFIKQSTESRLNAVRQGHVTKIHKLKWNPNFLSEKLDMLNRGFDYFIKNSNLWYELSFSVISQTYMTKGVDLILKFENLDNDFKQIQNLLNCSKMLPVKNTTKHDCYRDYYSQETIDIVATHFKDEIVQFNYDF